MLRSIILSLSIASISTTALSNAPESPQTDSFNDDKTNPYRVVSLAQVGHTDGWDKDGNWIGCNIYGFALEVEPGTNVIGHFCLRGSKNSITFREKIVWQDKAQNMDFKNLQEVPSFVKTWKSTELPLNHTLLYD